MSVLQDPLIKAFPDLVPPGTKFEFYMIPLLSDAVLSEQYEGIHDQKYTQKQQWYIEYVAKVFVTSAFDTETRKLYMSAIMARPLREIR